MTVHEAFLVQEIEERDRHIAELEAQIEKMKRCSNCENGKGHCEYRTIFTTVCDKWQLRR